MTINRHKINKFLAEKFNFVILKGFPRHSIRFAKKYFRNKKILAAEIGTYEGYNAKSILKELNIQKLYLVDPYINYADYLDYSSSDSEIGKKLGRGEKKAKRKLKKYKEKIVWVKKFSSDAIKDIKEKLDFVYIDGNHDYKFVKEDMENYYKKLKKGGVLAGHDIATGFGVGHALIEFCAKRKLKPSITVTDWYLIKND